jgi:hypothetical protein
MLLRLALRSSASGAAEVGAVALTDPVGARMNAVRHRSSSSRLRAARVQSAMFMICRKLERCPRYLQ